ncbi:hypothetical protein [Parachitinimonas caeni]|uniref:Uncharacterized protein n=1 Tax=Parachitinimonas caeni TaxID=3031301 RepID=A0ABT7DZJ1_9NEIS|nr:hypothetical protein [Parachitinimonas caeni]MDK2125478.1 hypothetical protein [Parachitinimonas caeni]
MTSSAQAAHLEATHESSKIPATEINLLAGFGVQSDAHDRDNIRYRSRVAKDPTQPDLRQVQRIYSELITHLPSESLHRIPGDRGNIMIMGVPLLTHFASTLLGIGVSAIIKPGDAIHRESPELSMPLAPL